MPEEVKSLESLCELEKQTKLLINLPEELKVWSLESLCELEKQTKLLINPPRSRRFSRTGRFAGTTCGVVEDPEASGGREAILDKAAEEVEELIVEPSVGAVCDKAAGGDGAVLNKAAEGVEAVLDRAAEEVEGPVVESRPQQDTRLSLGRGNY